MFYSTNVLQKKGPLGAIWIAAHHDVAKKLTRSQILTTDIVKTAGQIENPEKDMALRLSSHLLVGLSRIYTRKVEFLFTDCNEALSKITLAFRPSNVDLGPVNKAQIKSITIDESAIASMDLDLDLDLQDADWLAPQMVSSQPAATDITLPETGGRKRTAASNSWDEEDPLLGGGWEAGDSNPLDLAFEDPEMQREEEPEKHRSSDAVGLQDPKNLMLEQDFADAPEMPDFEVEELPEARPSDVHSLSTPGRKSVNERNSVLTLDATPLIGLKKAAAKQASKKRKVAALDESTEISKDDMLNWIHTPKAVQDLVRQPRSLPLTRQDAQNHHHEELNRKGQLAEHLISEPLSGSIGRRVRSFIADTDSHDSGRLAKKRKEQEEQSKLDDTAQQDDAFADNQYPDFEAPDPGWTDDRDGLLDVDEPPATQKSAARQSSQSDREDAFAEPQEREEDEPEYAAQEQEDEHAKAIEQQERTKKVVLMLQKNFRAASGATAASKTLHFTSMIRSEETAPSRHTAAVAFFECLGLQAKGMVNLTQPDAYGEIVIASTPSLLKFKA